MHNFISILNIIWKPPVTSINVTNQIIDTLREKLIGNISVQTDVIYDP